MAIFDASLAILPTASWALANIFAKKASVKTGGFFSAMVLMAASIIPIALFALTAPVNLSPYAALLGIIAGILAGSGFVFAFKCMETQQVSNTMSLILIQSLLLTIFGVYGLGEKLGIVDVAAGIVIIAGCILVGITKELKFNKMLLPAVAANILWASTWIVLSYAINTGSNSNDILLVSRIAGAVVLLILFLLVVKKKGVRKRMPLADNVYAAMSGVLNGLGNVGYAALVPLGLFALGGIMQSMNPAITTIIAYFAFREKLTRLQIFGLVIATAGAVAIGVLR